MQDDEMIFAEPEEPSSAGSDTAEPWKLLIVDDEEEVHSVTTLALANFRFDGRKIEFLHAYSGADARQIVGATPDIGLILLDVIMETDDAGLEVARYIREDLGNRFVRIILRTGQPGHAPEKTIINNYDINDYKEKTELTATKLYTVIHTGLASYRDLIRLEQTRRELLAANESLRHANRDLEHFAHVASHDLQAPLRTISAFSEQLEFRYGKQLDDKGVHLLRRIGNAATRLRDMIRALLQLSQAGRALDLDEAVELGALIDNVMDSLSTSIDEAGARIEVSELPAVTGNPALLEELLANLLQNAIKYRNTERECTVQISGRVSNGQLQVDVRDNGIGMPGDDTARIFNAFERAHDRQTYAGTGIGLATCRRIVERHGGRIWASSALDQGMTISFTLPLQPQPVEAA